MVIKVEEWILRFCDSFVNGIKLRINYGCLLIVEQTGASSKRCKLPENLIKKHILIKKAKIVELLKSFLVINCSKKLSTKKLFFSKQP